MKKGFYSLALATLSCISLLPLKTSAQNADAPKINVSGYLDTYIATDNDKLASTSTAIASDRQFTYVNAKKNQFGLNIGQIGMDITGKNYRGVIVLQQGDLYKTAYVSSSSVSSPMIQQANAGFMLCDKVWIDAGYFLTHIGGESFLPKDNWLSSHSLVTYYEPFYQAGVRAGYEGEKLTAQVYVLNGNAMLEDNNEHKTLGLFLSYKASDQFTISYADVIGNEEAGSPSASSTHMLHNIVAQYTPSEALSLKAQIDYATKTNIIDINDSTKTKDGSYLGASLTAHYTFSKTCSATARFAYVDNSDGVYTPSILKGMGITLGAEYKPSDNTYVRIEGTNYSFDDKYKLFKDKDGKATASRMELALNFGIMFSHSSN